MSCLDAHVPMKYLKSNLLERCRSLDHDVAEAASDEWDRAIDSYNAELAVTRPRFPPSVRLVLDQFSLHDAKVLILFQTKKRLSLLVRLEGDADRPGKTLELKYTLTRPGLRIVKPHSGQEWPKDLIRIQYDEFGKALDAPTAVFTHSLLLAGGHELRIRFTDFHARRLKKVVLPPVEQAGLGSQ
jgi:hypothetical protein